MLHRLLDVIFQYLALLVGVLIVVPVAVLGAGIALDRTQVVTARLWADEPAVLADSPFTQKINGLSAAQHQSTLLNELLLTDSFVAGVIRAAPSGTFQSSDPAVVGDDLRKSFLADPAGPHVLLVTYGTQRPEQGVAVTRAVIVAFQEAQQSVQEGQVTVADAALTAQLTTARKDMDESIAATDQYRSKHGPDSALAIDPTYQSLRALASLKVENYNSLVQAAQRTTQYQSAIPTVQPATLRMLDEPQLAPWQLKLKGAATKDATFALIAVLVIELLFVYNLTRRDQRVRTTREVVSSLGLLSLGTVPDPRAR
jgi:hypothetical protein